jgi:hypothetical protein
MRDEDLDLVAEPIARFECVRLWEESIEVVRKWWMFGDGNSRLQPGRRPLTGVRAIVNSQDRNSRDLIPSHEVWLTISGPGFEWAVHSNPGPTPRTRLRGSRELLCIRASATGEGRRWLGGQAGETGGPELGRCTDRP